VIQVEQVVLQEAQEQMEQQVMLVLLNYHNQVALQVQQVPQVQ